MRSNDFILGNRAFDLYVYDFGNCVVGLPLRHQQRDDNSYLIFN